MSNFFHLIFIQPIFNLLIGIYNFLPWHDIGVATIILTVFIRLILAPLFYKSSKQQLLMNKLQPEIQKIQKEYKDDKEKLAKAQMELFSKHKVNPFSNCFLILLQLPIMFAVYRVFLMGFSNEVLTNNLYSFVNMPQNINPFFLGIINLNKANIFIAILSAVLQFISTKIIMPSAPQPSKANVLENPAQKMTAVLQKQMLFIGPIMTFIILVGLPSILGIYWSITTVISIIQQKIIQKKLSVETKPTTSNNGTNN
ncbi:MAG: YidC/Oxa1 family membrane protein insertase [Patescibacteria group bacterium]|nr:YidC/Oxa1 family membrane protein insertase [Patescibacteria group bacterium]